MEEQFEMILAIDPGNVYSGYVLMRSCDCYPLQFGKIRNEELLEMIKGEGFAFSKSFIKYVAIEMIASYGMPVGAEVFETCVWIGRFEEECIENLKNMEKLSYVYRRDEKSVICNSPKANDATIKMALRDRFAPGVSNYGKGSKKDPGFFYGFKADVWQAFAVGVTFRDRYKVHD